MKIHLDDVCFISTRDEKRIIPSHLKLKVMLIALFEVIM